MKLLLFRLLIIIATVLIPVSCSSSRYVLNDNNDVSPYDFGLATAKTEVERYEVLLKTHRAAVATGVNVDYTGIDTIRLEIPARPSRIPLTRYNDFKGCVFIVKNTSKNCWLFGNVVNGIDVTVAKEMIDRGDFRTHDVLGRNRSILIIEDEYPWVLNRKGHDYGHQRKDILLIENGVAKNSVVMPYNNEYSNPKCSYIRQEKGPMVFKNITIERTPECTFLTYVAYIDGFDDVRLSNINLYTPESALNGDRGIRIYNCTNVSLDNVRIEGTYSQPNHFGYGINLGNVWNFKGTKLYGKANWGIFGNNNVNTALIEDSQINRFDIHCYGRDMSFKDVAFFDLYNQFSSVYGTILYDKCTFTNFVPVLNGGSYNSFVAHDVVLKDCIMYVTPKKNHLFKVSHLNEGNNPRKELYEKCLPNMRIINLVLNMTGGTESFYLYYCTSSEKSVSDIGYVSSISIDGLTINPEGDKPLKEIVLSNITINTKRPIDCKLTNVKVYQPQTKTLLGSDRPNMQLRANMPLKGGKATLKNVIGISQ